MRRLLTLAFAVVVGFAAVARAEPLDLKQIAADAKWAAHLDFDALHASTLFQKARRELLKRHPEAERHLAMLQEVWKFVPATDLHGVTIYGTQVKRETGVAIVRATVNRELLLEKAKQAPDHQASAYGKHELHSWTHAKGSKHERSMTGAFYKPDVMVFGTSADEVKAALDVLDGAKPSFAGKESGLNLTIPPGAILVAGATALAEADLPCKSSLAKRADAIVLAIGENQGETFVVGQLVAKQAEIAQQIKTVLDGALALATITKSDDVDALKLINAVKVTVADKAVSVELRASADSIWAEARKACAKWEAHKEGHHRSPGSTETKK